MKKYILLTIFCLIALSDALASDVFHGTSLQFAVSTSKAQAQTANFLNFRWVWNINKIVEIGACYSVLESDVKSDFVDEYAKTKLLYELNYGGLDFGFYPIYNDDYSLRAGVSVAGGGYKFVAPNGTDKVKNYGAVNIGVYEPSLEFAYFISSNIQIDLNASYRFVYKNPNISSFGAGIGVKYGIFK